MPETTSAPILARDDDPVRTTVALPGEEERPPKWNPIEDAPTHRKGEDDQRHTTLAVGEEGRGLDLEAHARTANPFGQF